MLAQLSRQREAARTAVAAHVLLQQRGMKLFDLFSKEKREERKRKLREEIDRGYFDDFRDFRDKSGKVFAAPERLVPESHAPRFPPIRALLPDGACVNFPPMPSTASTLTAQPSSSDDSTTNSSIGANVAAATSSSARSSSAGSSSAGSSSAGSSSAGGRLPAAQAALVCVAFRAGAQPMIEAWAADYARRFAGRPGTALYELSLVEGMFMRLPPFKQMLLREGSKHGDKYMMPVTYLFRFGDGAELCTALQMNNRLTGYVFLVDNQGRLRWRGSGHPDERELHTLERCAEELLQQR